MGFVRQQYKVPALHALVRYLLQFHYLTPPPPQHSQIALLEVQQSTQSLIFLVIYVVVFVLKINDCLPSYALLWV